MDDMLMPNKCLKGRQEMKRKNAEHLLLKQRGYLSCCNVLCFEACLIILMKCISFLGCYKYDLA